MTYHLTLNMLSQYLAKFECSNALLYTIVSTFKSIYIYRYVTFSIACLCRLIDSQYYSMCSNYPHALSRARHLSMDAPMTRCSMLSQAFTWRQRHSEKTV